MFMISLSLDRKTVSVHNYSKYHRSVLNKEIVNIHPEPL